MHQDSPIGYRMLMRTNKIDFSKEDSWVISSLLSLSVSTGSRRESIAESIIDIFSGHSVLKAVTRFSLVRRLGCSNRLMVLSSANKGSFTNSMQEGYSCFVSGNGSLFRLKSGVARFFKSANEVVERYELQGQPPQRSIGRIAKMGLASGITTGIFDNNQLVGFVFLNGDLTRDDFEQEALGLLLINLYQILGFKFAEYRLSRVYYSLYNAWPAAYMGGRLNTMKMSDTIRQHFLTISGRELEVTAKILEKKSLCLVSHGDIAQIIARAAGVLENATLVNLEISLNDHQLLFDILTSEISPGPLTVLETLRMDEVIRDAYSLGFELNVKNNVSFCLSVSADYASKDGSIEYSVE